MLPPQGDDGAAISAPTAPQHQREYTADNDAQADGAGAGEPKGESTDDEAASPSEALPATQEYDTLALQRMLAQDADLQTCFTIARNDGLNVPDHLPLSLLIQQDGAVTSVHTTDKAIRTSPLWTCVVDRLHGATVAPAPEQPTRARILVPSR